jgi:DNA mismatch repair protein MSH2
MPADEQHKDYDLNVLHSIADRCGVIVTDRKASEFGTQDIEPYLSHLLRPKSDVTAQLEMKLAMASAFALFTYLGVSSQITRLLC